MIYDTRPEGIITQLSFKVLPRSFFVVFIGVRVSSFVSLDDKNVIFGYFASFKCLLSDLE